MAFQYLIQMMCIGIEYTVFTLLKQKALAMNIVCQILMLIRTDMIRLQICKNAVIKYKTAYTV